MQAKIRRPAGAAAIAILAIIVALAEIFGGVFLILSGAVGSALSIGKKGMLVEASIPVGLLALTLAILSIVFAIGMLLLKPWTWSLGFGVNIANIALSIILGIIGGIIKIGTPTIVILAVFILCCAIILFYLFTPGVRRTDGAYREEHRVGSYKLPLLALVVGISAFLGISLLLPSPPPRLPVPL